MREYNQFVRAVALGIMLAGALLLAIVTSGCKGKCKLYGGGFGVVSVVDGGRVCLPAPDYRGRGESPR